MSIAGEKHTAVQKNETIGNFWALWSVTVLGNLSDGVIKLAVPLVATSLTRSPGFIAMISFVLTLPWLIFALPVGAFIDRWERKQILVITHIIRIACMGLLIELSLTQYLNLIWLYLLAFVLGTVEVFADSTAAVLVPSVVPDKDLEKANARLVGAQTVMNEFLGPPLGGALATLGLVWALGSSASFYVCALMALFWLRGAFRPHRSQTIQGNLWKDIGAGFTFMWHNQLLCTLNGILAIMNMGWSAWAAVLIIYLVVPGPGGLTQFEYGFLMTTIGLGGVIGTLIAEPVQRVLGRRWTICADILGTFVMLAVPAFTANPWLIGGAAVIGGMGSTMWNITVRSLIQRLVPDDMRGRMNGITRLLGYGSLSIGAVLAGGIAELWSVQAVFLCGAIAVALLFLPFFYKVTPDSLRV